MKVIIRKSTDPYGDYAKLIGHGLTVEDYSPQFYKSGDLLVLKSDCEVIREVGVIGTDNKHTEWRQNMATFFQLLYLSCSFLATILCCFAIHEGREESGAVQVIMTIFGTLSGMATFFLLKTYLNNGK